MKVEYVTEDGQRFDHADEAVAHEKAIADGATSYEYMATFTGVIKGFIDGYSARDVLKCLQDDPDTYLPNNFGCVEDAYNFEYTVWDENGNEITG